MTRFRSIRTTLIIYFTNLILLTIIAFMFFSIKYTKENIRQNSEENSRRLIEQVNFSIENYIDYMENISEVIIRNRDVYNYLFHEDKQFDSEKIEEEFNTILQVREDIYNIAILGDNGKFFINDGRCTMNPYAKLEEKEWYQQAKQAGENISISSSHVQNLVKGSYKWVVTLSRGIKNQQTGNVEGLFAIDLNYGVISNLCESIKLGNKGYVYIVEENGEMIYHPQQQLILSGVKKELLEEVANKKATIYCEDERGEKKIYTSFYSEKTGWTIVGVLYESELENNENTMKRVYGLMAILLIMLGCGTAFIFSERITNPIKQLEQGMKEVQKGIFKPVYIKTTEDNEIASLNRCFNKMTEQVDELMKKNMQEQAEKRKSELMALQSQINPHFLYNTLDSIIWMIETEDYDQAILMTSVLARFFRLAIGNASDIVTISQELEYTRNYLLIQQMRYRDKVTFSINVNEDILQYKIVKLVLQPLVENALYHGLKYKEGCGNIQITGYRAGESIILKVMDDGIGMDEDELAHVFERKQKKNGKHNGVGLGNIQNRLKLYYGDPYGITIDSEKGYGTTITIVVPICTEVSEQ